MSIVSFDPVQGQCHGLSGCQRPLYAIIAPGWVSVCHAQDKFHYVNRNGRPSDLLAASAIIPFCCHQFTVPAQNRLWRYDSSNLLEHFPSEYLAFHRQKPPLIIVEWNTFISELFSEDAILGTQVLDRISLFLVDQASEDQEQ